MYDTNNHGQISNSVSPITNKLSWFYKGDWFIYASRTLQYNLLLFSPSSLQTCFSSLPSLISHFSCPADCSPNTSSSLSASCLLCCLCSPSFGGSVWCVSLWSFCSTVHPVDRKHPVHHHSQLPVGSAGSVWPICVILCQMTGVWLHMIPPHPNQLPGERGREAGETEVQVG